MKKEIREKKDNIIQVTTLDERFYAKGITDEKTGLPIGYEYIPSVTWICGYYPKGIPFYRWLADKGWNEAEAIKNSAGDKGSKVHFATEEIEKGEKVEMESKFLNPSTGQLEELTVEEYECILSFQQWLDTEKPGVLASEITVFGEGYAGTIDRIYRIDGQIYILDIKTSKYIWEEHKLQISAYSHANINYEMLEITKEEWENRKHAVLQLGYTRNKNRYKFTEVEDKFEMFMVARQIWANENPDSKPKQIDLPLFIQSEIRKVANEKLKKK